MRLRSGYTLSTSNSRRSRSERPSKRLSQVQTRRGPNGGIVKPTSRTPPKDRKPTKLSDLPADVLQMIMDPPQGITLRRRDVTNALKMRSVSTAFRNFSLAYKNMFTHCRVIDLTIANFMEIGALPEHSIRFQAQIIFLVNVIGHNLLVLKIPELHPMNTKSLVRHLIKRCHNIRELSFTDSRSISADEALGLLNICSRLQAMEVSDPGEDFLTGVWRSRAQFKKLSLLRMESHLVPRLCVTSLFTRKGMSIEALTLGENWSQCMYNRHDCGLRKLFKEYGRLILENCVNLRKLSLYTSQACCATIGDIGIDNLLLGQMRTRMSVEYTSNHQTFYYNKRQPFGITSRVWERSLLLDDALQQIETDEEDIYRFLNSRKLPDVLKVNCARWRYFYSAQVLEGLFGGLYDILCTSVRKLLVLDFLVTPQRCRYACKMLSYLKRRLPLVDIVYVSFEIVAYTGVCSSDIEEMIKGLSQVKELHLLCQRKGHRFSSNRVGYPRFVRNLSRFLSFLEKHCSRLECLTMERADIYRSTQESWKRRELLQKGIKRVSEFESRMQNVDVSTLTAQLQDWFSQIINEG